MILEEACKYLLQRSIKITLDRRKLLRRGKLLLFNFKDHVITFTIKTHKGALRTYEIYYPYDVINSEGTNEIIFDYTLDSLMIEERVGKKLKKKYKTPSTIFDDRLVIEYE